MAVRIAERLFKNLLCIFTRSLDACSGVLVGWNVGLRLKALKRRASCEFAVAPSKAWICFTDFLTRVLDPGCCECVLLNLAHVSGRETNQKV